MHQALKIMWKETRKQISRKFNFANPLDAFAFVYKVGMLASKHRHYPKINITQDKVEIILSTDKIGGYVTQKDHEMAEEIDEIYGKPVLMQKTA